MNENARKNPTAVPIKPVLRILPGATQIPSHCEKTKSINKHDKTNLLRELYLYYHTMVSSFHCSHNTTRNINLLQIKQRWTEESRKIQEKTRRTYYESLHNKGTV